MLRKESQGFIIFFQPPSFFSNKMGESPKKHVITTIDFNLLNPVVYIMKVIPFNEQAKPIGVRRPNHAKDDVISTLTRQLLQ